MSWHIGASAKHDASSPAFCAIWLGIILVLWGRLVLAQNITPNPNFDTQLSPWVQYQSSPPDPNGAGASAFLGTVDINNSPTSGSGRVTIDTSQPAANAASGIAQCVDFSSTSISLINYGINVRVPSATTTDASINATLEMRLFSGAGCSGFIGGGTQGRTLIAGTGSDTTWYLLGDASFIPPGAPVTASSAQIRAYLRQVNGGAPSTSSYVVEFDAEHLVLNATTPVRLQSFDVE